MDSFAALFEASVADAAARGEFGKEGEIVKGIVVVVFATLDVDVDLVSRLDGDLTGRIVELAEGDHALALAADVDDDVVALYRDDNAFDDLSLFSEFSTLDGCLEEGREGIHSSALFGYDFSSHC